MYVFNIFRRFIGTKVPHKEPVIEMGISRTVRSNFQLFLAHVFFQSEYSISQAKILCNYNVIIT